MARGTSGTPTNKPTGPTAAVLKADLDKLGIKYSKSATKSVLAALLADPKKALAEQSAAKPNPAPKKKAKASVSVSSTASRPVTNVANQTMAPIIFPRHKKGQTIAPLVIPAGSSVPVDTDEWELRKKNRVVQSYIDHNLLSEVNNVGQVPVSASTTSELPIPEHLQDAKETADMVEGKGITKETPGTIEIK